MSDARDLRRRLVAWCDLLTDAELLLTVADERWDADVLQVAREERNRRGIAADTPFEWPHPRQVLLTAADYLDHFGWVQRGYGQLGTSASMVGAIIICAAVPGGGLARHILAAHLGIDIDELSRWNDEKDRTAEQVVSALRGAGDAKYARFRGPILGVGDARVYDLSVPLEGHTAVVVSAVTKNGTPETYTFPATEESLRGGWASAPEILSASFAGARSHTRALRMAGYTVVDSAN